MVIALGYCLLRKYKIAFFLLFIIFLTCNINFAVAANTQCDTQIHSIQVAKVESDQKNKFPEKGWLNLKKLPDRWENRWPDFHDTAWYKITFDYNCPLSISQKPFSFAIESITISGKIFLNNQLLWQDVTINSYITRSQHIPRIWNIPYSQLNKGENTLLIQVNGIVTQQSGLGHVILGNYEDTYKKYNKWVLEKRTLPIINMLATLIISLFFFLAWLANRKDKAFLWLSLANSSWALYVICILHIAPLFFDPLTIDKIQNIIFCFYVVSGCLGAWYFAKQPLFRIQKMLFLFFIIATLSIVFSPIHYINQVINFFFVVAVIIFLLKNITYPYFAYKAKQPETYFLAFVYLIYIPIALHDAKFMMTMEGYPLSPYVAPLTTMCMGAILALRLARSNRQIEKFNQTLEASIIEAKQQLTSSLAQQYELSVENARLQERINLSHDLHDGLGGSIVRSIMYVEKNHHIEKNQIVSILKMLRNDLRQVIDTGSIESSTIPSSPIEWGASIRYKFIQIFDEIDIDSNWYFAEKWKKPPSALQCLTLTRVTEEALTNVLKHSQATKVKVSLIQDEDYKIILKVEDNGQGFDPKMVESGLHIGLQSMKIRIQRLNGDFSIHSKMGQTLIEAVIKID